MACANCGGESLIFIKQCYGFDDSRERFDLFRCTECDLVCTYPPLPPETLGRYYHSNYYGGGDEDKKTDSKFHPWIEALVRIANSSRGRPAIGYLDQYLPIDVNKNRERRFLDVGCGRGTFIRSLAKLGYSCVGTEISHFSVEPHANLTIMHGKLGDLNLPEKSFDCVWIWHVLEHTSDPRETIREISRTTKPNGIVAIAVPHFGSWQSSLFGKHWFHLDLPRHQFHFTIPVLVSMLKANHFEPISIRTLSWEQNVYGWIQSAQNVLFYRKFPNGLYSLLKRDRKIVDQAGIAIWFWGFLWLAMGAILLFPAIVATIIAATFRKGGTLMIHARRLEITEAFESEYL